MARVRNRQLYVVFVQEVACLPGLPYMYSDFDFDVGNRSRRRAVEYAVEID
jgi:hypothetical protein